MNWRKLAPAVALAAALVGGCSSSSNSDAAHGVSPAPSPTGAAQVAAHGVEAAIATIPWSQVGPGWMLATWSPVPGGRPGAKLPPGSPTRDKAASTLYLITPTGGRYPITTFPPPGQQASPELVDWSGDGSHALFDAQYATPPSAIMVDLHTGKQTTLPVQGFPRFSRPNGKALLLSVPPGPDSKPATLDRVDLTGTHQLTYPTDKLGSPFNGNFLSTPDGMRLALGTSAGLALMGNDGTPGPTLPIPDQTNCSPLRWWDESSLATVLASCDGPGFTSRLWLVPVDGSPATALTAANDGKKEPDLRDASAWQLPAGTFVQAAGACGYLYLAKLNADGTTAPVAVSGVQSGRSVIVAGVNGADLDLLATAACGSGQSLVDYNPGTNTSNVLLGPPLNGGGVIKAVAFPGQR
ncbi:MAG TPA: hypothetical protein VKI00_05625 [Mycobacterium sp.]|uniref:hypothetical protein n=1 Tax=Mycobacterium sp. TaxID=1785 RepID=UPI002BBD0F13|nr:hypothetical protein [Mycobacterium sp.]HME75145.1 hypothetical protein [Mycobacterium sp.]